MDSLTTSRAPTKVSRSFRRFCRSNLWHIAALLPCKRIDHSYTPRYPGNFRLRSNRSRSYKRCTSLDSERRFASHLQNDIPCNTDIVRWCITQSRNSPDISSWSDSDRQSWQVLECNSTNCCCLERNRPCRHKCLVCIRRSPYFDRLYGFHSSVRRI